MKTRLNPSSVDEMEKAVWCAAANCVVYYYFFYWGPLPVWPTFMICYCFFSYFIHFVVN